MHPPPRPAVTCAQTAPVRPGRHRQRPETGGDVRGTIGVNGATATFVSSVQRTEQIDDLGPAHLTDHQSGRAVRECLPDQVAHRDRTGTSVLRTPRGPARMRRL